MLEEKVHECTINALVVRLFPFETYHGFLKLPDHVQWSEIWRSPEKQLEEMMKAPALPFVRNLDMEFLRTILLQSGEY